MFSPNPASPISSSHTLLTDIERTQPLDGGERLTANSGASKTLKGVLLIVLTPFLGLSKTSWLLFPTGLSEYLSCSILSNPLPVPFVNSPILFPAGLAKFNNLFFDGVDGLPSLPPLSGEKAASLARLSVELGGLFPLLFRPLVKANWLWCARCNVPLGPAPGALACPEVGVAGACNGNGGSVDAGDNSRSPRV